MKNVSQNRRAFYDYSIEDTYEAGIVLTGSEIKSIMGKTPSIAEAYVKIEGGEAWLVGSHIPEYDKAGVFGHDPKRKRKLLLHKREIAKIKKESEQRGYTVVPIKLYFNERHILKIEIGLGKGKKNYDKREALKKKASSLLGG